jgi:hypothetical protein
MVHVHKVMQDLTAKENAISKTIRVLSSYFSFAPSQDSASLPNICGVDKLESHAGRKSGYMVE